MRLYEKQPGDEVTLLFTLSLFWGPLSFIILLPLSWELSEKLRRVGERQLLSPTLVIFSSSLMLSSVFSGNVKKKKKKKPFTNTETTLLLFKVDSLKRRGNWISVYPRALGWVLCVCSQENRHKINPRMLGGSWGWETPATEQQHTLFRLHS